MAIGLYENAQELLYVNLLTSAESYKNINYGFSQSLLLEIWLYNDSHAIYWQDKFETAFIRIADYGGHYATS